MHYFLMTMSARIYKKVLSTCASRNMKAFIMFANGHIDFQVFKFSSVFLSIDKFTLETTVFSKYKTSYS